MAVRMDGEIMSVIPPVGGGAVDGVGVSEKERMKVGSVLAGPGGREGEGERKVRVVNQVNNRPHFQYIM